MEIDWKNYLGQTTFLTNFEHRAHLLETLFKRRPFGKLILPLFVYITEEKTLINKLAFKTNITEISFATCRRL